MKYITPLLLIFTFLSFRSSRFTSDNFTKVEVDTLLAGGFSSRAITIDGNKIWYAADKSRYGYYDVATKKTLSETFSPDTLEFRSIAQTSKSIFLLNVASPAFLVKVDKASGKREIVHKDDNKKIFYDSMQFWNDKEGIAMGDPIENCLSVLVTRNGGNSWTKIDCAKLPKTSEGEAAFAASNTNIVVKGNNTWIVTGGKHARVLFSSDKAKTWKIYDTPIVSGKSMTGIFTADFYDAKIGMVAGGDYERQNRNQENKAITYDGGKTWKLIAENEGFGYASCIQFVPKSKGLGLASVGASGLHYSCDGGKSWKQLLNDYSLYTIRFANDSTAYAAGKDKLVRIRFKK
ncbi:oxidoreductase [Flavobacterium sp.]|uniref:sialidase family protein n=1 Tax=Flavobacterium sp. TaxID=239 RepID=UPI001201F2A1|nr:oxidoreductase [Flavobacterium sp.]RZJ72217.1 MAG: oxidoreductase [Flavobacterium sp.]